jgi:hypothetical protein
MQITVDIHLIPRLKVHENMLYRLPQQDFIGWCFINLRKNVSFTLSDSVPNFGMMCNLKSNNNVSLNIQAVWTAEKVVTTT